jgi:hypothetical protein
MAGTWVAVVLLVLGVLAAAYLAIAQPARSPPVATTARAVIRASQRRAALTGQQARSSSLARLASFTGVHRAADAAVGARVRILRQALGLPPPESS